MDDITLPEHEENSEKRAHHIGQKIHEIKEEIMSTDNTAAILAAMGNRGGDAGLGMGGGLIGGVVLGALLGNRGGLFGNNAVDAGVVNRDAAPLNGTDGMAIIGAIGNVKDVVNASTASLTSAITTGDNALMGAVTGGFSAANTNTLQQTIMMTQLMNGVNQNVSDQGCRTREAVAVDGAATRSLITQLNTDNLNRLLTVADLDRRDEANRARSREVEVNVTQTVNQNQMQLQAQQQQQQQTILLSQLCAIVGGLQNAVATNSNLIVGNSAPTTTGAQTANPVNVKT